MGILSGGVLVGKQEACEPRFLHAGGGGRKPVFARRWKSLCDGQGSHSLHLLVLLSSDLASGIGGVYHTYHASADHDKKAIGLGLAGEEIDTLFA